jgi:hypothetical protein
MVVWTGGLCWAGYSVCLTEKVFVATKEPSNKEKIKRDLFMVECLLMESLEVDEASTWPE